jgi:hypothetical protein
LKDASFLSTSTEREAEQHMLLHHGGRHEKCSCFSSSSVRTAVTRKMKKS